MHRLLVVPLVLTLLAAAPPLPSTSPFVADRAGLFSQQAIAHVEGVAADIQKKFGFQVFLDTAKTLPGLEPQKLKSMRTKDVLQTLRKVAQDRADDRGVRGLYVLITLDPKHVTVVGWPADRERESNTSDVKREHLRRRLANLKDADRDVMHAFDLYRVSLRDPAAPAPLKLVPAVIFVGAVLGVWLLLSLIRFRLAKPNKPQPIYRPAMMGSLFGVPAGFWVHDRLFQGERPAVPAGAAPAVTIQDIMRPPEGDEA